MTIHLGMAPIIKSPLNGLPVSRLLDRREGWMYGTTWQPLVFAPIR